MQAQRTLHRSRLLQAPLMKSKHCDVLILGAGVIGLSSALALLKRGASVRLLDRGTPGSGSSHGNCGTITPSHAEPLFMPGMVGKALRWMLKRDAPFYVSPKPDLDRLRWLFGFARRCNWRDFEYAAEARAAILQRSRQLTGSLVAEAAIDCAFAEDGTLYVYRDAAALKADAWHADLLDRLGIEVQRLGGAEVEAMEPALLPGVAGGELHPGDAHLRPNRFVAGLERLVREAGGIIEIETSVTALRRNDGRIAAVLSDRGEFSAEHVVLALGAWSPQLARQLRLRLPMQPGKGYSLTTSRPQLCPRRPLTLHEDSVCVTFWDDGFRLGSTMEFSGYAEGVNRLRLDALKRGARRYLHQPWGAELKEEWWGWRPMCVDELPLIGPSTNWSNLYYATAHGMMGMSMSLATAELVAADLAGGAAELDPAPYRPARFGL